MAARRAETPVLRWPGRNVRCQVLRARSGQHGQDVSLAQNEERLAVDHDFSAAVFPEQHLVADFDFHGDALAVIEPTCTHGEDLAFLRLLFRCVGDEQPATGLLLTLERSHDHAVGEGTDSDGCCILGDHTYHASLSETTSVRAAPG